MQGKDYYQILGIKRNATKDEVKKAYFSLVRKYPNETHPNEFIMLTKAYKTLFDPQLRKNYDAELQSMNAAQKPNQEQNQNNSGNQQHTNRNQNPNRNPNSSNPNNNRNQNQNRNQNRNNQHPNQANNQNQHPNRNSNRTNPNNNRNQNSNTNQNRNNQNTNQSNNRNHKPNQNKPNRNQNQNHTQRNHANPNKPNHNRNQQQNRNRNQTQGTNQTGNQKPNVFNEIAKRKKLIFYLGVALLLIWLAPNLIGKLESNETTASSYVEDEREEVLPDDGISEKDIEAFLQNYIKASVAVINGEDFALVDPYIASNGPKYKEQFDYTEYLQSRGITEQYMGGYIEGFVSIDEETFEVDMFEEYEIYYPDDTAKYKSFNSKYTVKLNADNELKVFELISTVEIESKDIDAASPTVIPTNYDDIAPFIDSYLKKSVASINNDDFSIVEPYLLSDSKRYNEQQRYVSYLNARNISYELIEYELIQTEEVSDNLYRVTCVEAYRVSLENHQSENQLVEHQYKVQVLPNGSFAVSELVYTKKI